MDVNEIIKTTLQAEIIKALKSAPEAIEMMVKAAIEKPVDPSTGRSDGYSSGKIPYLEYIVGTTLRDELERAVIEEFKERREEIRRVVKERLSADNIVDAVTKTIVDTAAESWRINVRFERDKER